MEELAEHLGAVGMVAWEVVDQIFHLEHHLVALEVMSRALEGQIASPK